MDGATEPLQQIVGDLAADSESSDKDLLGRVLDLYFLTEGKRSSSDTNSFGTVLEQMAYAASVERRAELANQLAPSIDAPTHLMRRLAFDTIVVSRPVLQYSVCLTESDLVTLATKLSEAHLLAIAHRLKLPAAITDVLVNRGDTATLATVIHNTGAEFSRGSLDNLAKKAETDPELRFALGLRPDLNLGLFNRFKSFINDQLIIDIGGRRNSRQAKSGVVAPAQAEAPAASNVDEAGSDADAGAESSTGPAHDEPDWTGPVTEKALVEIAREGQLAETLCCMAQLTGLDMKMANHCLLTADLSALMVLCKANDFSNATFSALMNLREANTDCGAIDVITMLKRYEAMKSHTAKRIIQYADKKAPKNSG